MMTRLETLKTNLQTTLGADIALTEALGELTLEVPAEQWFSVCTKLRTEAGLRFETCVDLCGVDYLTWGNGTRQLPEKPTPASTARASPWWCTCCRSSTTGACACVPGRPTTSSRWSPR